MSDINTVLPAWEAMMSEQLSAEGHGTASVQTMSHDDLEYYGRLSAEERKMVDDYSKTIDLHSSGQLMSYGSSSQKKLDTFSRQMLDDVRGRDLSGGIGELLEEMALEIRGFNDGMDDELNGKAKKFGFFKKVQHNFAESKERILAQYDTVSKTLDRIVEQLDERKVKLLTDIQMAELTYKENLNYFRNLTMYILAGRKAIIDATNGELQQLKEKADRTKLAHDAQAYGDFGKKLEEFEKQLYNLELTRTICLQLSPQIRLLQQAAQNSVKKIDEANLHAIPVWRNQISLGLMLDNVEAATRGLQAVSNLTGELLKRNSERLHTVAVTSEKEAQKGFIDAEVVKRCNETLIQTIREVHQVNSEGLAQRNKARNELAALEEQLKEVLLNPTGDERKKKVA